MNWLWGIFIAAFIAILIFSIGSSMQNRYWIETNGTTYYTNEYKEKDGCIEFRDYSNHMVRQCGFYSIRDMGEK